MLYQKEKPSTNISLRLPAFALSLDVPYFSAEIQPNINFGSHTQSVGIQGVAHVLLPEIAFINLFYFYFQAAYFYSFNNLGIPDPSHTGFFSGAIGISLGRKGTLKNSFIPLGKREHNFIYQYSVFLDTIDTGQTLGIIGYYYSRPKYLAGFMYENDGAAVPHGDSFRTASFEITTLFNTKNHLWGIGLGMKIWTGNTYPFRKFSRSGNVEFSGESREFDRRATIDITNSYGGRYIHGVLYLAIYYESFKLSMGWDSNAIRGFIQNTWHYIIDYPIFKTTPITQSRFYIQLEINHRFSLY